MWLVETDHVTCFNQLHGLFGTSLTLCLSTLLSLPSVWFSHRTYVIILCKQTFDFHACYVYHMRWVALMHSKVNAGFIRVLEIQGKSWNLIRTGIFEIEIWSWKVIKFLWFLRIQFLKLRIKMNLKFILHKILMENHLKFHFYVVIGQSREQANWRSPPPLYSKSRASVLVYIIASQSFSFSALQQTIEISFHNIET